MSRELSNMTMALHNLGVSKNQIQTGLNTLTRDLEKATAQIEQYKKLNDKFREAEDRNDNLCRANIALSNERDSLKKQVLHLEELMTGPSISAPRTAEEYSNLLAWREQDKATIQMLKGVNRHLIEALSALESSKAVG